jgi:hypothetical protein
VPGGASNVPSRVLRLLHLSQACVAGAAGGRHPLGMHRGLRARLVLTACDGVFGGTTWIDCRGLLLRSQSGARGPSCIAARLSCRPPSLAVPATRRTCGSPGAPLARRRPSRASSGRSVGRSLRRISRRPGRVDPRPASQPAGQPRIPLSITASITMQLPSHSKDYAHKPTRYDIGRDPPRRRAAPAEA